MSCPFPLPCSSLRARSADAARRAEESLGLGQWLTEGVGTVSESKRIADTSTSGDKACGAPGKVLLILAAHPIRSEEHTSELQSLMRHSYSVFCLKKKK